MEEARRRALRRCRVRLVAALRVAPLWAPLEARGVFTRAMVEELQSAGTRREQARQLVIDLETRGKQAFPTFVSILRDTGQGELADLLSEACELPLGQPADVTPVELDVGGETREKSASALERVPVPVQDVSDRLRTPPAAPRGERSSDGRSSRPPLGSPAVLATRLQTPSSTGKGGNSSVLCVVGSAVDSLRRNSDLVYDLKADPCGYCLILNNVNFSRDSELSTRTGSNIDCEKLEKRFKSLHFSVLTRQDLKAQEIVWELRKLARLDHSALDCCLVVILSHGCQTSHIQFPGGIYGTDGKAIPVEKIVNYFNGSHCPSLRGKPKLFFIQACGGEQKDQGFEVESDSPGDEAPRASAEFDATPFQASSGALDEPDAVASLPTPSDILVSYSTFPGFVSWRDRLSGSWYVETLDDVLDRYAHSEDLLNMLLRVAHAVSAKGRYKQIPGCFNFLRKKFFFMHK
ncbi:caspase-9 [Rhea pennata]|uniref:caspase-9 n=1 Tax=Rhea pennata TaxID=8795 RepID=UPI002E2572B9